MDEKSTYKAAPNAKNSPQKVAGARVKRVIILLLVILIGLLLLLKTGSILTKLLGLAMMIGGLIAAAFTLARVFSQVSSDNQS